MSRKIAFAGLRHGHINGLFQAALDSEAFEITGICEENQEALEAFLAARPGLNIPIYHSLETMLKEVDCQIIATGDYYGKRGSVILAALNAGKHVIADKPLCTSLAELDEIEKISSEKHLSIGCMLDLRTYDPFTTARKMILAGELGEITQIQFGGQHPLMKDSRPHWYFEPGKHGGTINDIAIHAMDFIPWMTGMEITKFAAARTWKAFDSGCDCFNDAAQFMLVMENGCGILGDVSYAQPDSHGYKMPHYWRFTVWGTKGVLEFNCISNDMTAWINGEAEPRKFSAEPYNGPRYLDWFQMELDGKEAEMNTKLILKRARQTLELQKLADEN